jgi:hypothetical protein
VRSPPESAPAICRAGIVGNPQPIPLHPSGMISWIPLLREYDTVARADNYLAEYRMLFSRRRGNERDIFEIVLDGTSLFRRNCIDVIKSRLRKNLKAPASSRIMSFLKEGEIRRRKKCSERLKELDRNVSLLPCSALDWTWGKGIKDVFIQYITKFTKVQSHVSFKILELVNQTRLTGL